MKCPNCGSALSCGCQQKVASDKKTVCTKCIVAYEANLKKQALTNSKPPKT